MRLLNQIGTKNAVEKLGIIAVGKVSKLSERSELDFPPPQGS
jgi:hypothetical protein